MTCIVGVEYSNKVYIGGDSASVAGNSMEKTALHKVFKVEDFLIGYTYTFRSGQVLQYQLIPPKHDKGVDDLEYLSTVFVDTVRELFKVTGILETKDNVESGSMFLLGYNGKLYTVSYDFQINRSRLGYASVGSGSDVALGSLYSTKKGKPKKRIKTALKASSEHITTVRPPFIVESI